MPNELKPCPFCGKEKPIYTTCAEEACGEDCIECNKLTYSVVCSLRHDGCGASGGFYITKEEAAAAWNRRANDEQAD